MYVKTGRKMYVLIGIMWILAFQTHHNFLTLITHTYEIVHYTFLILSHQTRSVIPVSYTHLDVYKRQFTHTSRVKKWKFCSPLSSIGYRLQMNQDFNFNRTSIYFSYILLSSWMFLEALNGLCYVNFTIFEQ